MRKLFLFSLGILSLVLFIISCRKPQNTYPTNPVQADPGKFIATINGGTWNSVLHKAKYYIKWNQLYIFASDNTYELRMGINVDPIPTLKNYLLESNGKNAAEIITSLTQYNSNHNVADAGGSFLLTKFDTSQKMLSGRLQFKGYSSDRSGTMLFTTSELTDIPLTIESLEYDGSYAEGTIVGATTTNWQSRDFISKMTCTLGNNKALEIRISSILGGSDSKSYILLRIPLNTTKGTYQVFPDLPPNVDCGSTKITSRYNLNNYNNSYYATSGTINIVNIDTTLKKLNGSFSMTFKDTTSRQEIIQVTNGIFNLNSWKNL